MNCVKYIGLFKDLNLPGPFRVCLSVLLSIKQTNREGLTTILHCSVNNKDKLSLGAK